MKNYLLLFSLILFCNQKGFSQFNSVKIPTSTTTEIPNLEHDKHRCGTPSPDAATRQYIMEEIISKEEARAAMENSVSNCLPMKIHIVRQSDGSGGLSLGELAIAFANLNYTFFNADIEFFVCGDINYIDDDDFYNFNAEAPDNDDETAFTSPHEVTNAINVFFMNDIVTSSGFDAAGYAYFPFNNIQSNRIFMINSVATNPPNSTFSHELGHYFSLYHTHEGTEDGNTDPNAENVPRIGTNANCAATGDLLCDTDADPRYSNSEFNFSTCTYTGSGTDVNAVPYLPTTAINNIMSYYPDQCGGVFTGGQFTRMASGLVTRMGHSAYNFGCTAAAVIPASGLTATQNGNQIDLNWTDNASNELGYIIERSTTSNSTGFLPIIYGGVAENISNYSDTDNISSNTTYYYRVRPVNSACDNYSNVITVTTGLSYCTPSYSQPCVNSTLDGFSMDGDGGPNEINNTGSGCSTNSYGNFTNLVSTVTAGVGYPFTVCKSLTFNRAVQLWVDWNQDGDFNDANEQVLNASANVPSSCFTGILNVPSDALSGNTVLRVLLANGDPTDPCGTFYNWGETEDYTLNVDGIGALPVELINFEGNARAETVVLNWETASEYNNDFFTLERSKDGIQFEPIAEIKGAGTDESFNTYSYTDLTPIHGDNYYRLKQTDFDGKFEYSEIIVIPISIQHSTSTEVVPNPVRDNEISLLYTAIHEGKMQIQILDVNGKLIKKNQLFVVDGKNNFTLNISNLNAGIYFLQTIHKNETQTTRFVKL